MLSPCMSAKPSQLPDDCSFSGTGLLGEQNQKSLSVSCFFLDYFCERSIFLPLASPFEQYGSSRVFRLQYAGEELQLYVIPRYPLSSYHSHAHHTPQPRCCTPLLPQPPLAQSPRPSSFD